MPPAARRARIAPFALVAGISLSPIACSHGKTDGEHAAPSATTSAAIPAPTTIDAKDDARVVTAIDALASDACVLGHRGALIDLGDASSRAQIAATDRDGRIETIERDGATWARVLSRGLSLSFLATADDVAAASADGATPVIEARVRGGSARSIAVYLNGRAAGTWPLDKNATRVVSLKLPSSAPSSATAPSSAPQIIAGTNELLLRFRGAARGGASDKDEQAEIDWVHVGGQARAVDATDEAESYAAPTRAQAIASVTLGGGVMRAVSIRAPGYERCVGWLPANGRLVGSIGASAPASGGDADVELRALRDRAQPIVLASMHVAGGAPWKAFDVALDKAMPAPSANGSNASSASSSAASRGTLGAIELVATRASRGVRVAFGEPRVVVPAPAAPPAIAPARGVVLVVLGDVAPRSIALYGSTSDATPLPELDALAKTGVAFDANRAACGAESCAVASMLTALPPRAHAVVDQEAGLAPDVTTLADVARQAGIRAAMFTSNPSTSSAFGFARGWDTFVAHPPEFSEAPGTGALPFDDAAKWIAETTRAGDAPRFLVVVHVRGGHPPWDASPDELRVMAPADYTGSLDPKTAAELLAHARPHLDARGEIAPRAPTMHLTDSDRARAWALYQLALRQTDAALGRLVAAIKASGHDADTLLVVTGDVGLGDARAPLEDPDVLDESSLATPLVVRFPHDPDEPPPFAARHVASPTTDADVARTIVSAFGLALPTAFASASDLSALAAGASDPRGRPLVATYETHDALAWGSFVLRARTGESAPYVTKLCDRTLEPTCTSDVRGAFPLALLALTRELASSAIPAHPLVPVVESPAVRASLKLWGL